MSMRLRDLIRSVRACKTAADERAAIARECADIRRSFKEEEHGNRTRNIAKLMYIHMLGYPTHWGQMECVKLVASPSYTEKRIGYLGLMVLLDEKQEVLMLVTNSLKNDLGNTNQFIVGLALCTLGNISSPEIARDLATEVEKLLSHSNPYIRKKAALCAVRIIRKVPELLEYFVNPSKNLIADRSHGVLLTGMTLILEICKTEPELAVKSFRPYIHEFLRILRNLMQSTYAPDHDVSGFTDPFLQTKIIRVLRYLGTGNTEISDIMTDVLAQIINNTETIKSVGSALLYECVLTIMQIDCNSDLKTLAINTLGKFLTNKDNNTKFVALNTLTRVYQIDTQALNRQKATILECLRDPDIAIRQRALELIYALIDQNSVQSLLKELLTYLIVAEPEFKDSLAEKICSAAEKFSPNKKYHFDTVFDVMLLAGASVKEDTNYTLIHVISSNESLHGYAVGKFQQALAEGYRSKSLLQCGLWCLGEYGHFLVSGKASIDDVVVQASELDVIALICGIMQEREATLITQQYALNALVKLSGRFAETYAEKIKGVLSQYLSHMNADLQQRSVEYTRLLPMPFRSAIVEQMPLMDDAVVYHKQNQAQEKSNTTNTAVAAAPSPQVVPAQSAARNPPKAGPTAPSAQTNLLDLDLLSFVPNTTTTKPQATVSAPKSDADLLLDLLGGPLPTTQQATPSYSTQPFMTPMGSGLPAAMTPSTMPSQPPNLMGLLPQVNNTSTMYGMSSTMQPVAAPTPSLMPNTSLGLEFLNMGPIAPQPTLQPNPTPSYNTSNIYGNMMQPMQPQTPVAAPSVLPSAHSVQQPTSSGHPSFTAFQKGPVLVSFELQKAPADPTQTTINITFSNNSASELSAFVFQVAVPKYLQMKIGTPSGRSIQPHGSIYQQIQITNTMLGQKSLMMKAKLNYQASGAPVQEQFDITNFPAGF